jgi:hypothetical protein
MKTKNISKMVLATFIIIIGCGEDLLDKTPYGTISQASFYKTETDMVGAVNSIYAPFFGTWGAGLYNGNGYNILNALSDDGHPGSDMSNSLAYVEAYLNDLKPDNAFVVRDWQYCYQGIFRANLMLEQSAAIDYPNKARLEGEAKFLRAFFYHFLNIWWNGVPLITSPNDAELKTLSRATSQQVWTLVEQDLKDAISGLPASWSGVDLGRPTKASAQGLLGRIYLYQKEWQKASDMYADVINSGLYHLMDNFADMFLNIGSDNLPESIFELQVVSGKSTNGCQITQYITPRNHWGGWGTGAVMQSLVDEFEVGDERRVATVVVEGDTLWGERYEASWEPWTGYTTKKYMYGPEVVNQEMDGNFKVIRYSEILLGYAETILNGASGKANISGLEALNMVRRRAGLADISLLSKLFVKKVVDIL